MNRKQKKLLIRIIAAAVIFVGGLFIPEAEKLTPLWFVRLGVFTAAYLTVGWDILWKAVCNIAHGHVFDENFLMSIASIGAMIVGESPIFFTVSKKRSTMSEYGKTMLA